MKKNLIFFFKNNILSSSNFFNYINQINIKFFFIKIEKLYYFNNVKLICFNDSNYKINQFLKISKKCSNLKIFFLKNIFYFNFIYFFINKKIKFLKNFIFIIKKKSFIYIFNNKKNNYVKSILFNYLILNKKFKLNVL